MVSGVTCTSLAACAARGAGARRHTRQSNITRPRASHTGRGGAVRSASGRRDVTGCCVQREGKRAAVIIARGGRGVERVERAERTERTERTVLRGVMGSRVTLSEAKGACLEACPLRFAQGDSLGV